MTAVEDFIAQSDKIKSLMIKELLAERDQYQLRIDDLVGQLDQMTRQLHDTQAKLNAAETIIARMLTRADDGK